MRGLVTMGLIAAAIYVLFFMPFWMNLTADARLEPSRIAAVTAPHAGRILKIHTKTGQNVAAGDLLIQLDDTDLQLQRSETLKAIEGARVEVEAARRVSDLSKLRTTELRIEQLQLSLQTVERQIERCSIRALIDGVMLTEEPQHLIGATVPEGAELMQLGDLKNFDLSIEVPEHDLMLVEQALRNGAAVPVDFLSHAWPDLVQHAGITSMASLSPTTTISEHNQQVHVFRIIVPVELQGLEPQLVLANPTGRAKLALPDRSMAYRYGRKVSHFVRMTLFSLF
jgi:multidrug resistance efflux pump